MPSRMPSSLGAGKVYITSPSSFTKFMRFETNGMSWRRMSAPARVRCCDSEIGMHRRPRWYSRAHGVNSNTSGMATWSLKKSWPFV